MKDTRDGFPAPIRVFRPKWQVHFDNGTVFPATFGGIHLGVVAEQGKSTSGTEKVQQINKPFKPDWDILFIDNYVFEFCERADATIAFDVENGLPKSLDCVQNVAIDASSLSMKKHDVWYKKLRFILRNFPNVKRVTIIATVVLDIRSPKYMSEPMCHMDIQNISVQDRIRHGILFGEELKLFPHCTQTLRPSDFAIRAWNDLPNHWPSWKKRKEERTVPFLFMTAMVYFRKEWISLHGEGGPEGPCKLGSQQVDVAGIFVRNEVKRQSVEEKHEKRSPAVSKSALKKQTSFFLLGTKKSKFSLKNRPSMPSLGSQAPALVGVDLRFGNRI